MISLAIITGGNLLLFGLGLLFSVVGAIIAGRNANRNQPADETPTTISTRGTRIPLVMGRQIVGPVVAWAADRETRKKSRKVGLFSKTSEIIYYEGGMHILCVGPVKKIHSIRGSDGPVYDTVIDFASTPNGTEITTEDHGTFRVYNGNRVQGIDSYLAGQTDINSGYPDLCYIVWDKYKMGGSPRWDNLVYEVEAFCEGTELGGFDATLSTGLNPAHIIYQLLTAQYPHGANMDLDLIDKTSLIAVGSQMETDNLGMNMVVGGDQNTSTVEAALQQVLTDAGISMTLSIDGRLYFSLIREPATAPPEVRSDVFESLPEADVFHGGDKQKSKVVFEFSDADRKYRTSDIVFSDGGLTSAQQGVKETRADISTVTSPAVAQQVANRRSQEVLGDQVNIRIRVGRGATSLLPGQIVNLQGFGYCRVIDKIMGDGNTAEVNLLQDALSVPESGQLFGSDDATTDEAAAIDQAFAFFEVPAEISGDGSLEIMVARVRDNAGIAGAGVWVSADGGSYTQVGFQNQASIGGLLDSELSGSSAATVVAGPTFEPQNDDIVNALDLTGDSTSYNDGRQLLIVGTEIMFLESVTAQSESTWAATTSYSLDDYAVPTTSTGLRYKVTTAGTSSGTEPTWPTTVGGTVTDGTVVWTAHRFAYQLDNIKRAQYGTAKQTHATGSQLYIVDSLDLNPLAGPGITAGASLCLKTQPFTVNDTVSLSAVTPVCKDLVGINSPTLDILIDETGDSIVTDTLDTIEIVSY